MNSKALEYAERGYSIIPIDATSKRPTVKWEKYMQTPPTEGELEKWFGSKKIHIGIVTGKISGITVIDIDVKHTEKTPLSAFPPTYTVRTPSGGYHLYYQYCPDIGTSANQYPQYPYVDIRNDGGYVVAPPTETPAGSYEVEVPLIPAPFPNTLFPKTRKKTKGLKNLLSVGEGGRNNAMASVVGSMLITTPEEKWTSDAWVAVQGINRTYDPPLPLSELQAIFSSIAQTEQARRKESIPSPLQIPVEERIEVNLRKNRGGIPYKDMVNVLLILQQHPQLKDKIKYNIFRQQVEFNKVMLSESNLLHIQSIIQDTVLPGISKQIVDDAIQKHAFDNSYDEVLDWVRAIEWDGVERLATWLPRATYIEETPYHRAVGAQWLLGMMRRLVHPGCVFDHVLVLVGPQGTGKTSLFRILGGEWYKSYSGGLDTKDFYLSLSGAVLVDLDEGVTLYKSENIKMKSMITQTIDEFRAPYARRSERHPRRFVFSMSTNDATPFKDVTGNRRYWPVTMTDIQVDFTWLEENRAQLFAEAYRAITENIEHEQVPIDEALRMQEVSQTEDDWFNPIMEHISTYLAYRTGDPNYSISIVEVYKGALGGEETHRIDVRTAMRIGTILRHSLKMEPRQVMEGGIRQRRYFLTPKEATRLQEEYKTNPEYVDPNDF